MSSKVASPTATLLRNSRLFSIPQPLPRPTNDLSAHTLSNRGSESATRPYPVQQAIAVPKSSQSRGDWGLKRPLPLRTTTRTSTPYFRINAIDTREHITDFESSADLTLSLQKFHDLNLPISADRSAPARSSLPKAPKSVFESEDDHTDPYVSRADTDLKRWKFKGPWVTGMTQADLDEYVTAELKDRRGEFMEFLRNHRAKQLERQRNAANRQAAQNNEQPVYGPVVVSDEELFDYVRGLRSNYDLFSELAKLVQQFLDLPSLQSSLEKSEYMSSQQNQAPPTSHPSAGLSYLRTDSYLDNHPFLGPQHRHAPVEARVLSGPKPGAQLLDKSGKVGVGGVVSPAPSYGARKRSVDVGVVEKNTPEARDVEGRNLGISTEGGNRIWVEPLRATVDGKGRAIVTSANADTVAIGVHTGKFNEFERPPTSPGLKFTEETQRLNLRNYEKDVSSDAYGIGASDKKDGTGALLAAATSGARSKR